MPDTDFTPALTASLGERMRLAGLRKENARAWAEVDQLKAELDKVYEAAVFLAGALANPELKEAALLKFGALIRRAPEQ